MDLMQRGALDLQEVRYMVLDEADQVRPSFPSLTELPLSVDFFTPIVISYRTGWCFRSVGCGGKPETCDIVAIFRFLLGSFQQPIAAPP
jgi:hypothetical protein